MARVTQAFHVPVTDKRYWRSDMGCIQITWNLGSGKTCIAFACPDFDMRDDNRRL